jgi:hypothetical protein
VLIKIRDIFRSSLNGLHLVDGLVALQERQPATSCALTRCGNRAFHSDIADVDPGVATVSVRTCRPPRPTRDSKSLSCPV